MALTASQKSEVIFFLGWPGKTIVEDSTHFNSLVNDRLNNLTSDIEAKVASLLSQLAALDTKLEAAHYRLSAKSVGDIETNPMEIAGLKSERKRHLKLLSYLLDIPYVGPNGMIGVCV